MATSAVIYTDAAEVKLFEADLEHLAEASRLLRKEHAYTSAQRVDAVAALVRHYLTDEKEG